jgi:hypothetical protein
MARAVFIAAFLALVASALELHAAATKVLFPKNLHLTRQIDDPITGKAITIDEYCYGNRVVSISGDKTVVADYEKQEITEIDRQAGTYSVSRFDEVASIAAIAAPADDRAIGSESSGATPKRATWHATPRGLRSAAGRSVEQFEFAEAGGRKVEVGIDRSVALSEEALEVLIGAAYPNPRREEHDPLLQAAGVDDAKRSAIAANAVAQEETYGLPVTQAFTYSDSGTELTFRTTVTRIGAEAPPAELLIIPPAAKRVESRAAAVRRELYDLDQLPSSTPKP